MKFPQFIWILFLGFCLLSCQKEELARFQFPDLYPYPTVGMAEGTRNGQPWQSGAYTKSNISPTFSIVFQTLWKDWALGESLVIGGLTRLDSVQYKKMDFDFENIIYPSTNLPVSYLTFKYEDELISGFPQIASSSNYFRVTAVDTLAKTIQGDFRVLLGNDKYAPFTVEASFDVPYIE